MLTNDKFYCFCKGPLDNWHHSDIHYCGNTFFSSEQLFMCLKARFFKDNEAVVHILQAKDNKEAKAIGRTVKHFDEEKWAQYKESLMLTALYYKAIYDKDFFEILMSDETKDKLFVECNPDDKIWAIGLGEDDERVLDEKNWKGTNLLGNCLTHLANHLREGNCDLLFIIKDYNAKKQLIVAKANDNQ